MAAHLAQIARVNPKVNAIVAKLDDERCLALADEVPEKQYAKREESRSRQYEQEQKSRSSDHRDPGHDYEHHGARIRDQR